MLVNSEFIRAKRHGRGWTQQHMADASGLSLRTVQRVEKEATASHETVLALSSVLEIEIASFVISPRTAERQSIDLSIRQYKLALALATIVGSVAGVLVTLLVT